MPTLRLNTVRHELDFDGTRTLRLTYIYGSEEARVTTRITPSGKVTADCEELPADSCMDEIVMERHARTVARDHGEAFGDVNEGGD